MSSSRHLVLFVGFCLLQTVLSQYWCSSNETLVKQIDHVMLYSDGTAEQANATFNLLTSELGFPVAWPFSDYGSNITSGGVHVGGLNLEVIPMSGIAFQPCQTINDTTRRLTQLKLPYFVVPNTGGVGGFTNIMVTLTESMYTFFCKYNFDQSESREVFWKELLVDPGYNELRVLGAQAISVSVSSSGFSEAKDNLTILFQPREPSCQNSSCLWYLEGGPMLELQSVDSGSFAKEAIWAVDSLTLISYDIDHATKVLMKLDLLDEEEANDNCIALNRTALHINVGIHICPRS